MVKVGNMVDPFLDGDGRPLSVKWVINWYNG